jgi:hypothetical protein
MRKVLVDEAVGMELGYDITKIVPGKEKYRAFRRGHVIKPEDVSRLKDMGKQYVYVWLPGDNMIHEDEAALRIARAAAGPGIAYTEPSQGRVNLKACHAGLLKVQTAQLNWLNNLENVVFATLHSNRVVTKDQKVAGTRVVPVAIGLSLLEEAERLSREPGPLLYIKPFKPLRVAVVITGSEVSSGRIKDGFAQTIQEKIRPFGGRWMGQTIVPDDAGLIAKGIQNFVTEGADLIMATGGMSVDPDDATPKGIRSTGARVVFYGAPVLPGSQFMLAYQGDVPILGVPGGALFSRVTTLDLILPRIFAEDRIERAGIVGLGHGGMCEECAICRYPLCPFGKGNSI